MFSVFACAGEAASEVEECGGDPSVDEAKHEAVEETSGAEPYESRESYGEQLVVERHKLGRARDKISSEYADDVNEGEKEAK